MPHIQVETNIWDTDEATELSRLVKDEDAWRFVLRLWAWGIDSNCESGVITLSAVRIARIVGFAGNPVTLFNALVSTHWLEPRASGGHYMRGWSRNKQYFKKKRQTRLRMKRYRLKLKKDGHGDGDVTRNKGRTNALDRDRDRDRDRDLSRERGGAEGEIELIGQVVQAAAELNLEPPSEAIEDRIRHVLPFDGARLAKAITSTAKAKKPNWDYLAQCLETPIAHRKHVKHPPRSGASADGPSYWDPLPKAPVDG